jgi:hypothetical protein
MHYYKIQFKVSGLVAYIKLSKEVSLDYIKKQLKHSLECEKMDLTDVAISSITKEEIPKHVEFFDLEYNEIECHRSIRDENNLY